MYQRILVATDGATHSEKAVGGAIDLAAALGAELVALHVVPHYAVSYFEGAVIQPAEDIARAEKELRDEGQVVVDAVQKLALAKNVKVKAIVTQSDLVADSIMDTAKKHGCDLIVMASHGRKGIKRILMGSETQHVLTHSTLPILVLR